MATKPKTIDEYLAAVAPDQRAALQKLRKTIRAAAPGAEEYIGYGLAAFRLDGKPLVAFGATAKHCAFYPMSGTTIEAHQADLAGYDTSKGTIRFAAAKPLPAALVRKLVKARIAENAAVLAAKEPGHARTDPAVDAFLKDLDHPLKAEIEAVRRTILGADPAIREGIKWNAPSFRTTEWFATLNLRQDRVWLILHLGAKKKAAATTPVEIADPAGLLEWLASDRAVVKFADANDVRAKRTALANFVKAWIKVV
ncbi:MAG TPA: DUF1801 domain-containing protein [Gemmataceae bacterium]|jgi:uncharacterized protein YdhG (YjbR/CyaY superfamily)|nr:DUF1801 domain-containing protein [Gemmataceae bacterium]